MKTFLLIAALILSQLSMLTHAQESPITEEFSDGELAQLLAPIALYPDSILSHVLIASTYPLEIVQAERWISENPNVDAEQAKKEVENESWDASVKALVQFPELIQQLNDDLDWMKDLGDAFLQNEERVLASIQTLRQQAEQADSFDDAENLEVRHENDNIIIQSADREIIYVPYYDTRVVYGDWLWDSHPPVFWPRYRHAGFNHRYSNLHFDDHYSSFYWHPGVYLSSSFFFNSFHWSDRHIVAVNFGSHYWSTHSRNRYFDRGVHRRNMLSGKHSRQWRHSPNHRRGVAYRSQKTRNRFQHNRTVNKHWLKNKNRKLNNDRQYLTRDKSHQRSESLQRNESHQRSESLQRNKNRQRNESHRRNESSQRNGHRSNQYKNTDQSNHIVRRHNTSNNKHNKQNTEHNRERRQETKNRNLAYQNGRALSEVKQFKSQAAKSNRHIGDRRNREKATDGVTRNQSLKHRTQTKKNRPQTKIAQRNHNTSDANRNNIDKSIAIRRSANKAIDRPPQREKRSFKHQKDNSHGASISNKRQRMANNNGARRDKSRGRRERL